MLLETSDKKGLLYKEEMEAEPPNSLKIHGCDELPKDTPIQQDADCLERIQDTYLAANWTGEGMYGMALRLVTCKMGGRSQDLIVKVGMIDETELRIGCELNALYELTPVFPHTFGWLVCHEIPDKWLRTMTLEQLESVKIWDKPPLLFIFVQPVDEKWVDFPLRGVDHAYRTSLFILLHGLWVARTRLGFQHNDLHGDNLMLQPQISRRREPVRLQYNQTEVLIDTELVPRIIDYGRSETTKNRQEGYACKNDIRFLREEFTFRLKDDSEKYEGVVDERQAFFRLIASPEWRVAEDEYTERGPDIILPILQNAYFQIPEIVQRSMKRPLVSIERCFSCCASNPGHQIQHNQTSPKYFCNAQCYEKIHGICPFIL